ncbi:hypothetical protein AB990_04020 [Alkalihalobacillus pseudalcaliphilus]|nr:hypothetical protein AB990_04020 [Alkalihalobacillus pseudalcaliphilus]
MLANDKPKPATPRKTVAQLAREVLDNKWGNNPQRAQRLQAEGYDANAVQREVNRLAGSSSPKKSVDQLAGEVIRGEWGVNPQRAQRLNAAGYDAAAVQRRVNQLV